VASSFVRNCAAWAFLAEGFVPLIDEVVDGSDVEDLLAGKYPKHNGKIMEGAMYMLPGNLIKG
jgi:hypothetical protein